MMQGKRDMLGLVFLTIAALGMAGCIPHGMVTSQPAITVPATTLAPTETLTVASTPTDTETVTPSPTPESFPIDMARLRPDKQPASFADFEANHSQYLQAPDPLTDINAFNQWWEELQKDMGGDGYRTEQNIIE